MNRRLSKDRIYAQFARVGRALASGKRLEVLDLLGQAPRHVEALAAETGMPVPSVSQHLQVLRRAGLVECDREGTKMIYRVTDECVLRLWLALRSVAESRIAEVSVLIGVLKGDRAREQAVTLENLESLVARGEACLIDVRPLVEYRSGHLPGALSLPVDELPYRADEIRGYPLIVAYSRSNYCLLADKAVAVLRYRGLRASRLKQGWSEWSVAASAGLGVAAR